MEPSPDILDRLQKIHPWVRLGWQPSLRRPNVGTFCIVQLYHKSDVFTDDGHGDVQKTLLHRWPTGWPLYGKPYDTGVRIPIWVMNVDEADVRSGHVIALLKEWMTPIAQRVSESQEEAWKKTSTKTDEISEACADKIWSEGNRGMGTSNVLARKFIPKVVSDMLAGDYDKDKGKNTVVTPPMPNAPPLT